MLPLSTSTVLGTVPDATAAAEAAAAAVAAAATAAAAAAAAAAVAPMARLKLALPTGSPFAGGTPVTIQFRWERSTNLTGSEPPVCRFGQAQTAAQLLGDSTPLVTPAAYGTLPERSLLCHAPARVQEVGPRQMASSLAAPAPAAVCGAVRRLPWPPFGAWACAVAISRRLRRLHSDTFLHAGAGMHFTSVPSAGQGPHGAPSSEPRGRARRRALLPQRSRLYVLRHGGDPDAPRAYTHGRAAPRWHDRVRRRHRFRGLWCAEPLPWHSVPVWTAVVDG